MNLYMSLILLCVSLVIAEGVWCGKQGRYRWSCNNTKGRLCYWFRHVNAQKGQGGGCTVKPDTSPSCKPLKRCCNGVKKGKGKICCCGIQHKCEKRAQKYWGMRKGCENNLKPAMLGGPCTVVEIDESIFYKTKYNVGRRREHTWVFGMAERGTNNVIMIPVERRNAATLIPLIIQYIRPGTRVVSDMWAAYNGIGNLQTLLNGVIQQRYPHDMINHSLHFVDPNDPTIHTQSIEATWKACKQSMKHLQGTTQEEMPSYLYNYMFRRAHGHEEIFQNMLFWIRQYNGF